MILLLNLHPDYGWLKFISAHLSPNSPGRGRFNLEKTDFYMQIDIYIIIIDYDTSARYTL